MKRLFLLTTFVVIAGSLFAACGGGGGGGSSSPTGSGPATLPSVTTGAVTNVTLNSATVAGTVTSDGGAAVTVRGICYGTSENPSTMCASSGSGTGVFSVSLSGLNSSTFYYARAYAENSVGRNYGSDVTFTTLVQPTVPMVTTGAVTNITLNSTTVAGTVTSDGGAAVTARGICYGTTANPSTICTSSGSGTGAFSVALSGLNSSTFYYARAYADNSVGRSYGSDVTFTTSAPQPTVPTVITQAATDITWQTASIAVEIASDGGAPINYKGMCYGIYPNPTNGSGICSGDSSIGTTGTLYRLNNLESNTKYYVQGYVDNSVGRGYGNEVNFTTLSGPTVPIATTGAVTKINRNSAVVSGSARSDAPPYVISAGICYGTLPNPSTNCIAGNTTGVGFSVTLGDLKSNTQYYARAYGDNSVGRGYGSDVMFTTRDFGQTSTWLMTSGGKRHTVGLKTDGTLWAWGDNYYNQLGNAPSGTYSTNVPIQVWFVIPNDNWKYVAAGNNHVVAINTNNTLWAWGYGTCGSYQPEQCDTAADWQSAATEETNNGIALKTDGTLWSLGQRYLGSDIVQFGSANDWRSVIVGMSHTVAIKTDGTLWAWGSNGSGQLGDGSYVDRTVPVQIGNSTDWKSVTAYLNRTLAIKMDGTLWAWGASGWEDRHIRINSNVPLQVGNSSDWQSVAVGEYHTLGIKMDGSLWAWGRNNFGQLGDGTNIDRYEPKQIWFSKNWAFVATGENHTIAIKSDGTLWAWGNNDSGQLGIGRDLVVGPDGDLSQWSVPTTVP